MRSSHCCQLFFGRFARYHRRRRRRRRDDDKTRTRTITRDETTIYKYTKTKYYNIGSIFATNSNSLLLGFLSFLVNFPLANVRPDTSCSKSGAVDVCHRDFPDKWVITVFFFYRRFKSTSVVDATRCSKFERIRFGRFYSYFCNSFRLFQVYSFRNIRASWA